MIYGLFIFFMTVAVFALLLPILKDFIDIGVNATTNMTHGTTVALMLNYYPVFIGLALFIGLFGLIAIRR